MRVHHTRLCYKTAALRRSVAPLAPCSCSTSCENKEQEIIARVLIKLGVQSNSFEEVPERSQCSHFKSGHFCNISALA